MESSQPTHEALFANLRELVKAYRAGHDSVLKFSWKKMWPFSQFLPQVDFPRVMRVLTQTAGHLQDQAAAARKLGPKAPSQALQDWFALVPAYAEALADACRALSAIAQYKQNVLEGQAPPRKQLLELMDRYQHAAHRYTESAEPLRAAWVRQARASSPPS